MWKTDEFFRNNKCISFVSAVVLFIGIVIGLVYLTIGDVEQHDPQKILQLRAECLKDDPSLFTTNCDNFAEKYSRINR